MNATITPAVISSIPQVARDNQTAQFFALLFGEHAGYIELAWIDGDPDQRRAKFQSTWLAYRVDRLPALLARITELAGRYGNVYVSAALYDGPRRAARTLPTRAIVVDDLPTGEPCSFSVETSPGRRQGYFLTTQLLASDRRADLARRAAYALGGDRSGWDRQQLVRVPGTFNTKARAGGRFLVHAQLESPTVYEADDLDAAWPAVATTPDEGTAIDWATAEHWVANIAALIGSNGLPRRLKPTTVAARTLARKPDDTSSARYVVAQGLVLHGYPDDEIAALLWHCCDYGKLASKGEAWLKTDITRIIRKLRSQYANIAINPTRRQASAAATPSARNPPARRGRRVTLTPANLHRWYTQNQMCATAVILSVAEVAEQLKVSRATVERCERVLRTEGVIARRTFAHRQGSFVAVLVPYGEAAPTATAPHQPVAPATADEHAEANPRPVIIPAQHYNEIEDAETGSLTIRERAEPAAEPADLRPLTIAATDPESCCAADLGAITMLHDEAREVPSADACLSHQEADTPISFAVGVSHPPTSSPPPTPLPVRPPPLRIAVAEAFDYLAGRQRITRQMLVMFLESKYPNLPLPSRTLDRQIETERQRRTWEQQLQKLRTIRLTKLKALSRLVERILADGPTGPQAAQLGWANAMYSHVVDELERRAALRAEVDPQRWRREARSQAAERRDRRTPTPALRAAALAATPQAGAVTGVCSPYPTSTQHELFSEAQASHRAPPGRASQGNQHAARSANGGAR